MNRFLTYVVVALVAAAVGALLTSNWMDNRPPEVVTEYDTIVEVRVDSVPFNLLDSAKVDIQPVTITIPDNAISTTIITDSVQVETSKYTGVEELPGGTIDWEIYADKLYATKFKLTTEKETIVKTVTKTLPAKSRLYAGGGVDLDWVTKAPQSFHAGLMYNRRQKWQVGVNIRHDVSGLLPSNMATTAGFQVYIGL